MNAHDELGDYNSGWNDALGMAVSKLRADAADLLKFNSPDTIAEIHYKEAQLIAGALEDVAWYLETMGKI